MPADKKYSIVVQTIDEQVPRQFYLSYVLPGAYIQMYDIKNHKIFLKKIAYPDIQIEDLYLTNILTIYNDRYLILDYSDQYSKKELSGNNQTNKVFALIKPINKSDTQKYSQLTAIIKKIQSNFIIMRMKSVILSQEEAKYLTELQLSSPEKKNTYAKLKEEPVVVSKEIIEQKVAYLSSGVCYGFELCAPHALQKWKKIMGNDNPKTAKINNPNSIRAIFGVDIIKNCVYGSNSIANAQKQINLIFNLIPAKLTLSNSTLCIVKPHIIKEKRLAQILQIITSNGFEIFTLQMKKLQVKLVSSYMEAYKFLPDYEEIVKELASDVCVLIELGLGLGGNQNQKVHAVDAFKKLCGPYDPQFAKKIQPTSLRGVFGKSRIHNAIQCTDLPQDAEQQLKLIFGK